jgi:endonuclease G
VWTSAMGENAIDWIANEGVRISRILKHLAGLSLSGTQATLRKQVLDAERGWRGDVSVTEMTGDVAEAALPAANEFAAWPLLEGAQAPMAPAAVPAREESAEEWLMYEPTI